MRENSSMNVEESCLAFTVFVTQPKIEICFCMADFLGMANVHRLPKIENKTEGFSCTTQLRKNWDVIRWQ
jgi:hypothetical protein